MEKVRSRDGTRIAYRRSGNGPALLLVHGTSDNHNRWNVALPFLEQNFTVYALDRRGRGGSGDAPQYSIEREFEDIAAVVDSIGGPVNVLGHSYGGECCLGAALLTNNMRRLVLYEADSLQPGEFDLAAEVMEKMQAQLEAGDRDGVVTTMYQSVLGLSDDYMNHARTAPLWPGRIEAAHTIPREISMIQHYVLDLSQFRHLAVPTLFLLGGESPAEVQRETATLQAAIPDSRVVILPGQQHIAMNTAPELFAREVKEFLTAPL